MNSRGNLYVALSAAALALIAIVAHLPTHTGPASGFHTLLQRLMGLDSTAETPTTAAAAPDPALAVSETDAAVETPAAAPDAVLLSLPALPLAPPSAAQAVAADVDLDTLSGAPSSASDAPAGVETLIAGEKSPPPFRAHVLEAQPGRTLELHPGHTLETLPGHTLLSRPGHTLESLPGHIPELPSEHHDAAVAELPSTPFAQGLQQTQAARAFPTTPPGIDKLVNAPGWDLELAQKVVWLSGDKQHQAELHLNPPHLGPLHIKLSVDENQTSAIFTSPHSAVRDAIENALPRLREVLAESGITLGNASVTSDSPRDAPTFDQPRQPQRSFIGADTADELVAAPGIPRSRGSGLVDLFA